MFDILTLNSISKKIYTVLDDNYAVSSDCASPDGILVRSFQMADYEIGDNLLAVARAGAGVNNIPIPRMTEKGIVVFNTPGANANAVKELVLCGILLASRDVLGGIAWASTLTGADVPKQVEKGKSKFAGNEIDGKTIGIVGLGAIGIKVANACYALGMRIVGYDPFLTEANKALLNCDIEIVDTLDELYPKADFITLHVPLLDSTRGMINADTIAKLPDGAVVLNMARGELVNVQDVKDALASGKLKGYVVDFPSEDCLNTKGIIAIPHLGASTEEAEDNCAVMASAQLKNYLEDGNIVNSVNFPALSIERTTEVRIAVTYNAGTSALDAIKALAKDAKFNYAEKKSVGYALIDVDACDEALIEKLSDLDEVVSIRIL
ncbi:MAG: 3-phosphoglycerate dehydrogenase [Clostridia bacterium]|nr:3-phosphoglycerate dehydrogenase [Clostridia bacterium]